MRTQEYRNSHWQNPVLDLPRLTGELYPQAIPKVRARRCPLKRLLTAAGSTAEPGSDLTRESVASLNSKNELVIKSQ